MLLVCVCVCICICAFVGVLYLRTKFVNDDWMVEKGFMESTVDEKDKWLGILQRPGLLCLLHTCSLVTLTISPPFLPLPPPESVLFPLSLALFPLNEGGGMNPFPNSSFFSPLPYKALQLVGMPSRSSTRRASIKCLCLMTRG